MCPNLAVNQGLADICIILLFLQSFPGSVRLKAGLPYMLLGTSLIGLTASMFAVSRTAGAHRHHWPNHLYCSIPLSGTFRDYCRHLFTSAVFILCKDRFSRFVYVPIVRSLAMRQWCFESSYSSLCCCKHRLKFPRIVFSMLPKFSMASQLCHNDHRSS